MFDYIFNFFKSRKSSSLNFKPVYLTHVLPEEVDQKDPLYNKTINRICYRGEQRRPYTRNGDGIFQIGFNNKNNDSLCKKINEYELQVSGSEKRLITDFESSQANTYAFSTQLESAAFFPMSENLVVEIVLTELEENLRELGTDLDLKTEFLNYMLVKNPYYSLPNRLSSEFSIDLKNFLKTKGIKENQTVDEIDEELRNQDTWIYIVFIDKGFDVTTHSVVRSLQTKNFEKFGLCFAQEICTDEVPAEHVFAAYRISRKNRESIKERLMIRDNTYVNDIFGSVKFNIKSLQFNETAIEYAKNKWHADVEKYKKILNDYMLLNQQHHGNKISVSNDGYHSTKLRM